MAGDYDHVVISATVFTFRKAYFGEINQEDGI